MEQRIKTKNIMGMVAGPASETSDGADGDRTEIKYKNEHRIFKQ
jgi:hypothetical protein